MDMMLTTALIVIGLPWVVLHYVTRWKTAATLTRDDEVLLEELYQLARRLDERMDTVERLVAADHPDFIPADRRQRDLRDAREENEGDSARLRSLFERNPR